MPDSKKIDNGNIKIITENETGYEINSPLRKFINFFLIPILNRLPRGLFISSSKKAKTVHEHVTTYKALEVIYNFDHKLNFDKGILDGFFGYFWQTTNNAKALRNRLKLVKKELVEAIHSAPTKKIRILSLACGSIRAVIEIIGKFKENFDFEVFGVDKNQDAIEYAQKLCRILNISHLMKWDQTTVVEFLSRNDLKFDIIEMVGFLDYIKDEKAVDLFNKIYFTLGDSGVFITGNIKDNPERKFVTEIVGWPGLIFRKESDLIKLIKNSKFRSSNVRIIYEPQNIHAIIIVKKKSE